MKFQAPKGTRDFYPEDMAWRNHLTDLWRQVSIRNGFEQVDGPIYETLDLYKAKSGEGIVSELFHFEDRGGRELAIRPEFTPTLARMVAQRANSMPRPIKWFSIPNLCRAERPQRGRLREHWQWNVDIMGLPGAAADAEVIGTAIDFFASTGLGPEHVQVKISHRNTVSSILKALGVAEEKLPDAFELLDRRDKIPPEAFNASALNLGLDEHTVERLSQITRRKYSIGDLGHLARSIGQEGTLDELDELDKQLRFFGLEQWCQYDLGIVRGLAYYTGTVFEIHEVSGAERAIAGGGRYDNLIESLGGPALPAIGFGMGDVVLSLVLKDKGMFPQEISPRPDVFILATAEASAQEADQGGGNPVAALCGRMRRAGLHARFSYKSTQNIGKLLKEASGARARFAVILGDAEDQTLAFLKDLDSGEQVLMPIDELIDHILKHRK
jgi:histidyl-tRNA synthetase